MRCGPLERVCAGYWSICQKSSAQPCAASDPFVFVASATPEKSYHRYKCHSALALYVAAPLGDCVPLHCSRPHTDQSPEEKDGT